MTSQMVLDFLPVGWGKHLQLFNKDFHLIKKEKK